MSHKQSLALTFAMILIGILVLNVSAQEKTPSNYLTYSKQAITPSNYLTYSKQAITPSNYLTYSKQAISSNIKVYFKNNSNTASSVRFEKDGYYFIYDLSGGQILWKEKPGQPAQSSTLGSGYTSNTKDTQVAISGNKATYVNAFSFTNVSYEINRNGLKENFILSNISSGIKDYLYLEYSGNIKFNKSLNICANGVCYTPSGKNDDFNTTGQIDFRDSNNNTIFYLAKPVATDSNGNRVNLIYVVHGSNAQMNFYLRIPTSFLQSAVYPIFIDPTIIIEITGAEHLDSNRLFIRDVYEEVSSLDNTTVVIPQNEYIRVKFEQNLSSEQDITIYAKSSSNGAVEVYEKNSDVLLATFSGLNEEMLDYRQLLTNLNGTQDTFDLKIIGGSVEFDYITDPTYLNYTTGQAIYGVFADGQNTNYLNLTCQFRPCALSDCSDASWVTYANNTFSDLSSLPNVSYFQFRSLFSTQNQNYTPYLFNFTIKFQGIDKISPLFSNNLISIANGSEYNPNNNYQFNITIENTNGTAGIEFNGVNYTLSNNSNSFYWNSGNLAVGTYSYYFWSYGNGFDHNFNVSQTYSYSLIKNSSLVLGLTATTPITYPTATDFTGSGCPSQLTCSLNISNAVYGAGTVSANYSTSGNENYTATSATFTVTINQNSTYDVSVFGTTPLTYPSPAGVSNSSCPSQITCNLYRNNTADAITSPDNTILAAGSYNYTFNTTGNANYSAKSSSFVLTINKNTSSCDIIFNATSPQTYPSKFRVYSNCTSAFYITRNGTIIANNSEQDLAAGTYNFTVFRNDSENYTNIVDQADFTIDQGTPVITKRLNGGTSNVTITYPQQVNATSSTNEGTLKIYRDNNDVTSENGLNITLGAGGYVYKFNVTGNANWTSIAGEYMQVNISKATPVLTFKANSGTSNLTLNYPQQINISATSNAGTVGLDKDGVNYLSNNGLNLTLGVGSYIFRANITGNANYSDVGFSYYNITINLGNSVVYTYLNNSRSNITIINGTAIWLNATRQAGEGTINLYNNGTLINSGTGPFGNLTNFTELGLFNITAIYQATQNYSASFETWWVNVTNTTIAPSLYCGDGTCNNGEICSTCSSDCGNCGGGSGGGGGSIYPTFWYSTYSNDYAELKNLPPLLWSLEERQRVSILVYNETHYVGVTDINQNQVTINVSSIKSQKVTLSPGESAKVEINNDSYYDLKISLNNIYKIIGTDKANITILYIHEGIPNGLIDIEMPIVVQNSSDNESININYITNSTNSTKLDICSISNGKTLGVCVKNIFGTMGLFIKNIGLFIKNTIGDLASLLVSYKCSVGQDGNIGLCIRNIFGNPFLLFVTFLVTFVSWAVYSEFIKKKNKRY